MQYAALERYLKEGFPQVHGWGKTSLYWPLTRLNDFHLEANIRGGIGEIGVHHGRSFIGIHNLKRPEEKTLALDVFDLEHLNIDKSGKGNLEAFRKNIDQWCVHPDKVVIMKADSIALTMADALRIRDNFGGFRFFSIDGGHSPEHTVHDFQLAEEIVNNGGILLLDDYFNPDWHGVIEGVAYLFMNRKPRFVPFMYTGGKHFFTTISYHAHYFEMMKKWAAESLPGVRTKTVKMYGYDVLNIWSKPDMMLAQ